MRRRYLSFDAWLCLALSALIALGTGKLAEVAAKAAYEKTVEAHAPVDGEIGGRAGEEVFRAQSVEDLLSHDTFSVVSGSHAALRGAGGGLDQ